MMRTRPLAILVFDDVEVLDFRGPFAVLFLSTLGVCITWPFATQATPQTVPALTFDPTPVPVSAADFETVMNRDLAQSLTLFHAPKGIT